MDTKLCGGCNEVLPLEQFSLKNSRTGQRHTKCKTCQRAYARQHYQDNKANYLAKTERRNAEVHAGLVAQRDRYLSACHCEICGSIDDLQLHNARPEEGKAVHEVISAKLSQTEFDSAIARSKVLCEACAGRQTYRNNLLPALDEKWASQESHRLAIVELSCEPPDLRSPRRFRLGVSPHKPGRPGLSSATSPAQGRVSLCLPDRNWQKNAVPKVGRQEAWLGDENCNTAKR